MTMTMERAEFIGWQIFGVKGWASCGGEREKSGREEWE
jgi:hypothetical protein